MHLCLYVCMCVCLSVCMHVCMYLCTYMCMYIYIYIYVSMYVYMYVCIYISLYVYIYIYIYIYIHAYDIDMYHAYSIRTARLRITILSLRARWPRHPFLSRPSQHLPAQGFPGAGPRKMQILCWKLGGLRWLDRIARTSRARRPRTPKQTICFLAGRIYTCIT